MAQLTHRSHSVRSLLLVSALGSASLATGCFGDPTDSHSSGNGDVPLENPSEPQLPTEPGEEPLPDPVCSVGKVVKQAFVCAGYVSEHRNVSQRYVQLEPAAAYYACNTAGTGLTPIPGGNDLGEGTSSGGFAGDGDVAGDGDITGTGGAESWDLLLATGGVSAGTGGSASQVDIGEGAGAFSGDGDLVIGDGDGSSGDGAAAAGGGWAMGGADAGDGDAWSTGGADMGGSAGDGDGDDWSTGGATGYPAADGWCAEAPEGIAISGVTYSVDACNQTELRLPLRIQEPSNWYRIRVFHGDSPCERGEILADISGQGTGELLDLPVVEPTEGYLSIEYTSDSGSYYPYYDQYYGDYYYGGYYGGVLQVELNPVSGGLIEGQ